LFCGTSHCRCIRPADTISYSALLRFTYILPVISEPNSVIWGIHIVIAVWLTFNVYWNYIKTIVTPPGEPWEDWVDHRPERDDDQVRETKSA
jgi:hypothetical protein